MTLLLRTAWPSIAVKVSCLSWLLEKECLILCHLWTGPTPWLWGWELGWAEWPRTADHRPRDDRWAAGSNSSRQGLNVPKLSSKPAVSKSSCALPTKTLSQSKFILWRTGYDLLWAPIVGLGVKLAKFDFQVPNPFYFFQYCEQGP